MAVCRENPVDLCNEQLRYSWGRIQDQDDEEPCERSDAALTRSVSLSVKEERIMRY
jgi:hypothetical protein